MPSRQGRSAEQPRATLYEEVTARIISELEHGIVPWVQPWGNAKAQSGVGLPCNAATRRSYSGINILILWGRLFDAGYPSQQWLTFRQAISLGGTVRKGEHGVAICYADKFVPKQRRTQSLDDPSSPPSGAGEPQTVAFLRRYTVFNVAQCDGLPDHCHAAPSPLPEREIVPEADALVRATLADIRHGGAVAYYECDQDYIQLPPQPSFFDQINYYRTLFHELGHWTGHDSRLRRDQTGRFGSRPYASEELVALS